MPAWLRTVMPEGSRPVAQGASAGRSRGSDVEKDALKKGSRGRDGMDSPIRRQGRSLARETRGCSLRFARETHGIQDDRVISRPDSRICEDLGVQRGLGCKLRGAACTASQNALARIHFPTSSTLSILSQIVLPLLAVHPIYKPQAAPKLGAQRTPKLGGH